MKILGAGLAGLIAGAMNETAEIYEPFDKTNTHQALLRFRSPLIGEAVGIPFREVSAYKGIWFRNEPVPLSPVMMVYYSKKVSDRITHRSIRHLETETRWMAPEGFQDMLRDMCKSRILYDAYLDPIHDDGPIISTIPINILADLLGASFLLKGSTEIIKATKPIYVTRFKIENCDAFMTNYYPEPGKAIYRASISGDTLIVESTRPIHTIDFEMVFESFGIRKPELQMQNFIQTHGKMNLIDEDSRKGFIRYATMNYGIYSLGRFAIWKDILLDDVYQDIGRIKHFINLSKYDQLKGTT